MSPSIDHRRLPGYRRIPQIRTVVPRIDQPSGIPIGTLPRVGALEAPRATSGDDGIVGRARSNPRWIVAIAAAAILILAWIGWAIYVTSSDGARAGLGVVIAWPAMLAALALVSLPFLGGYLLIRRLSEGGANTVTAESDSAHEDEEADDSEDVDDEEDEETTDEDEGSDEAEDEEPEAEAEEDESDDEESDSEAEPSAKS
jgi:hypothetical protein